MPQICSLSEEIITSHFSDFVSELEDTTSHAVIQVLEVQFSRHGIPDNVVSDNEQFSSQGFHEFSLTWKFNLPLSASPSRFKDFDMNR